MVLALSGERLRSWVRLLPGDPVIPAG